MKLRDILMSAVMAAVLAVGLSALYNKGGNTWNPFETATPAAAVFAPLDEYILKMKAKDGKYPSGWNVKDVARREIPYIMIYYSFRSDGYQAAFWDSEYAWIYDSASGQVYQTTDDISRTAWYDRVNRRLIGEAEAKERKKNKIEYYRL